MEIMVQGFTGNEDYKDLFKSNNIVELEDTIKHLEDYNILSSKEIVDKTNILLKENILSYVIPETIRRSEELKWVEDKHHIIIHVVNSSNVICYHDMFIDVDEECIRMDLCDYVGVRLLAITPGNMRAILNRALPDDYYDYDFMLKTLVIDCVAKGGTDLHINTRHVNMKPIYSIDYRRDNYMWHNKDWKLTEGIVRTLCIRTIANKTDINENDLLKGGIEASIKDLLGNGKYELRMTVVRTLAGYKSAIRVQKLKTISFKIEELGFDEDITEGLKYLSNKLNGLTLITGPIRSGKNTTAFAMTNDMDLEKYSIMDISSPVEIRMAFPQVDYGGRVEDLLKLLKNCKKLDLDLAVINEIPSKDVAFGVRDLINSSVGVITTTHLDRIWHLPHKLKEYYGDDYKDIISQINAVINQKMYVAQCPHCATTILTEMLPDKIKEFLLSYSVTSVKENAGCHMCNNGKLYGGIQPYAEMLVFTEEIKSRLRTCEYPYEMEKIIHQHVIENKSSLDYKVTKAISEGKLHYSEVYTII